MLSRQFFSSNSNFIRSVVGYIEEIIEEKTFVNREKNTKFRIAKFIMNNNDGVKLQCNLYDDVIEKFLHKLKLFEVNQINRNY